MHLPQTARGTHDDESDSMNYSIGHEENAPAAPSHPAPAPAPFAEGGLPLARTPSLVPPADPQLDDDVVYDLPPMSPPAVHQEAQGPYMDSDPWGVPEGPPPVDAIDVPGQCPSRRSTGHREEGFG